MQRHKTRDQIIAPGASDNPFDATPGAVEGQYASSSQSGVLRPTIGTGSVIVRDNSAADFAGLNRDPNDTIEWSQKESTSIDTKKYLDYVEKALNTDKGYWDSANSAFDFVDNFDKNMDKTGGKFHDIMNRYRYRGFQRGRQNGFACTWLPG